MRVFIERHSQALELAGLSHCTKTTYEDEPNDNYPKVTFTGEATGPDILLDAVHTCYNSGRWLAARGHTALLIAAEFVVPFRKGGKNDTADAEAIAVAARHHYGPTDYSAGSSRSMVARASTRL